MTNDPNEKSDTSLWRRLRMWLDGEQGDEGTPLKLTPEVDKKPVIRLSADQKEELNQAMDLPDANDTNFLPSDTSFRRKEAPSGGTKKVII